MDSDSKLVAEEHKLHHALVRLLKSVTSRDLVITYTAALQHLEFLAPWTTFEPSDSEDSEDSEDGLTYSAWKKAIWENRNKESQDRRDMGRQGNNLKPKMRVRATFGRPWAKMAMERVKCSST